MRWLLSLLLHSILSLTGWAQTSLPEFQLIREHEMLVHSQFQSFNGPESGNAACVKTALANRNTCNAAIAGAEMALGADSGETVAQASADTGNAVGLAQAAAQTNTVTAAKFQEIAMTCGRAASVCQNICLRVQSEMNQVKRMARQRSAELYGREDAKEEIEILLEDSNRANANASKASDVASECQAIIGPVVARAQSAVQASMAAAQAATVTARRAGAASQGTNQPTRRTVASQIDNLDPATSRPRQRPLGGGGGAPANDPVQGLMRAATREFNSGNTRIRNTNNSPNQNATRGR